MAEDKIKIEKFNDHNFGWWRMQIADYLYQKDLYLPLEGKKPDSMSDSDWMILDRKALATIRLSLTPQVAYNIAKEKTTMDLMTTLTKLYEKPSTSNKIFLMKKLFNLKMAENGSMTEHLNEFNTMINQLKSVYITFDDSFRALLFLCSLLESWDNLVMTVSNSVSGTLTFNDAVSCILNDEMRRKTVGETSISTALMVDTRERSQERKKSEKDRSKSRGKSKGRFPMKCWNYGKKGHMSKDCWGQKKEKGVESKSEGQEANVVSTIRQEFEDVCLSAGDGANSDLWFVDSGASYHCSSKRHLFSDFVQEDFGHVTVGNGQ